MTCQVSHKVQLKNYIDRRRVLSCFDFSPYPSGYFTGIWTITWRSKFQWSNPNGYGKFHDRNPTETYNFTKTKQNKSLLCINCIYIWAVTYVLAPTNYRYVGFMRYKHTLTDVTFSVALTLHSYPWLLYFSGDVVNPVSTLSCDYQG